MNHNILRITPGMPTPGVMEIDIRNVELRRLLPVHLSKVHGLQGCAIQSSSPEKCKFKMRHDFQKILKNII